jgi:hypothetical protein
LSDRYYVTVAKSMFEENNQQMPTLDDLLQLREEPEWSEQDDRRIVNNIGFVFMVDFMYGSLIGKRQWKKDKLTVRLSSDLTISDEAFVLLVLENNWDVFNGVANAEPKYTSRKLTSNKRNDGWSNEGITRYNELQSSVMRNRNEEFCQSVEIGVMNLLYENEKGHDARVKRDATFDDIHYCSSAGSKKKRFKIQQERVDPIVNLDDSDANDEDVDESIKN